MKDETTIENIVRTLEGRNSTAELEFNDLTLRLPFINTGFVINGKISFTAKPVHERHKA